MLKIESLTWANVKIGGQGFWQVLVIGEKLVPREVERVKKEYGTDHVVADWEQELLLSGEPDVIFVANGWSGLLEVDDDFRKKVKKAGIELRVVLTPKAAEEYNQLIEEGKRINALIHTTC